MPSCACMHAQVLKLQDTADAQAALNLLLGTQLNISPQVRAGL